LYAIVTERDAMVAEACVGDDSDGIGRIQRRAFGLRMGDFCSRFSTSHSGF
jgi:hypothetical protein